MILKRKRIVFIALAALVLAGLSCHGAAKAENEAAEDAGRLKNMIATLLIPSLQDAASLFYEPYLTIDPTIAPYYGTEITELQGGELVSEGTYSSHFTVTVEVFPYVGPHISVGKDRITLEVRGGGSVTVKNYEHLESHELPAHLKSLIKKSLP